MAGAAPGCLRLSVGHRATEELSVLILSTLPLPPFVYSEGNVPVLPSALPLCAPVALIKCFCFFNFSWRSPAVHTDQGVKCRPRRRRWNCRFVCEKTCCTGNNKNRNKNLCWDKLWSVMSVYVCVCVFSLCLCVRRMQNQGQLPCSLSTRNTISWGPCSPFPAGSLQLTSVSLGGSVQLDAQWLLSNSPRNVKFKLAFLPTDLFGDFTSVSHKKGLRLALAPLGIPQPSRPF